MEVLLADIGLKWNLNMFKKVVNLKNTLRVTEIVGKASALSVLFSNGFNVLQGFVVTSCTFFAFLDHNGLLKEIQEVNFRDNTG